MGPLRPGQVWQSVLLNLNLSSQVAQIIHRWARNVRCRKLWYFHTHYFIFPFFCHVLLLFLCWPTARGFWFNLLLYQILFWLKCAVTLACYPTGLFQSNLDHCLWVKPVDSLWHTSPSASGVAFHIYFIHAPHPCQCMLGKSWPIIYIYTNVTKAKSINYCILKWDNKTFKPSAVDRWTMVRGAYWKRQHDFMPVILNVSCLSGCNMTYYEGNKQMLLYRKA